jgi:hypothetical protein
MVAVKLPQIDKADAATVNAVTVYGVEIMSELEKCFKARYRKIDTGSKLMNLDELPENETLDNVTDEQFYRQVERSIISDLVCLQYTFSQVVKLSAAITPTNLAKYIKKAKADDAEVEYAGIEPKNVPFLVDALRLMKQFKGDAERKATTIGCVIDITDDLTYLAYLENPAAFAPSVFTIVRSNCN